MNRRLDVPSWKISPEDHSFAAVGSLMLLFVSQVHVGSLGRESAGSPILVAENVTSATTHVTKVEERAEPRLLPLPCLLEGKCVSAADGEGGILGDADREEDHHHGRRRRGPGAGGAAPHLAAHACILTAVPCFPIRPWLLQYRKPSSSIPTCR